MKKHAIQFGVIAASTSIVISLALLLFQVAGRFSMASLFQEAVEQTADTETPLSYETRISKGDRLFEAGYYELAANEYATALSIQQEAEAYGKLGDTYLELREVTEALKAYRRAMELSPSDETRSDTAHALIQNKQWEQARALLKEVSENSQTGMFYSATLNAFFGDHDKAKEQFTRAAELSGTVVPAWIQNFQNAYASFGAQQNGQAIYLKALLIKALVDANEFALAEELSLQTLYEKADYRDVWILLGYAQLKQKKYAEAEDSFVQAKKLDAVKPETHYFLGLAQVEQNQYEAAVDSFELALLYGFEPESEVYKKMALSQTSLGNYEDALEAYEYLVKIDSTDIQIFIEPISIAMNILGDLDRALSLTQEMSSIFPNEVETYNLLAQVYFKRGEWEQAQSSIGTALDIDGNSAEAYYIKGEIERAQENNELAKEAFKKAYELSFPGESVNQKAAEAYNALILDSETKP